MFETELGFGTNDADRVAVESDELARRSKPLAAVMGEARELSVLGGFQYVVGGEAVPCKSGSQRLLAFLAIARAGATRHQVARSLWPDSSPAHADSSLRSAISRLTGSARGAVRATGTDLRLAPEVVVDFHRSRSLARRLIGPDDRSSATDMRAAAVSSLSRELLPGWYDEWAVIAAEDWRQLRMHALEVLAARLTALERFAESIAAAQAAVRVEPLRESSRAALIRAHLAEGNRSEARGEFERYRSVLVAELGLEPTPRLVRLFGDPPPP